jgi:hypothetical protein
MKSPHHQARVLLTFFGLAAFLIMALGSNNPNDPRRHDHSTSSPSPEDVGLENAMIWAKANSTALAKKLQQVEMRRNHARSEVRKLEILKKQFPAEANKTEERIKEWQGVVSELDLALAAVAQSASAAYLAHQRDGKNSGTVLDEVYRQWSPKADRAIALAKKQQAKVNWETEMGAKDGA